MLSQEPANGAPKGGNKFSVSGLFSIFGLGRNGTAAEGEALRNKALSPREEAALRKGIVGTKMPEHGSLLNPEADQREYTEQRLKIDKLLQKAGPTPEKAGPILKALQDIDVVYLTPKEKGFIVNALLPHAEKMELVQRELVKVARSNFVSLRSEHPRAKEFLEQVADLRIVRLAEILKAFYNGPADNVVPNPRKDILCDGCFVGRDGLAYNSSTPRSKIPPVLPENGVILGNPKSIAFYINGLNMTVEEHFRDMQYVANQYGVPVIGIHNAKIGMLPREFDRGRKDAHNERANPTIDTVRNLVLSSIYNGEESFLVPVSHGGNIASRAIQRAKSILVHDGFTHSQIDLALKKVHVASFAGACWEYPDGPDYTHFVLLRDPVPFHFGLTRFALSAEDLERVNQFNSDNNKGFFAGVAAFRRAVAFKVKEPRVNPGQDASVFILDREEPLAIEDNPHSLKSYVPREQKLVNSWFSSQLKRTGTEG